ncbi:TetR/AcrR family transcriptional regulator [Gulosibacter sp. 10]|uniref:TetR/AcrR family transcriptional regulator n=1 Tax=Gulosibacter sp. 10 TaxID=1255570 RepID=UPI00097F67A1|nr:TetR/AcrR family transcriptional regulator [Gulosibacter sp. 10]SJM71237.1 Transcriptional regulator, TetR family [Gulosibacter sp. 10]
MAETATGARKRMSYDDRHAQLLDVAREFIRDEGSDALTLARLAERAGVTKPLVYQHFGTKSAVLAELYAEFKSRTRLALDAAIERTPACLGEVSRLISDAYIGCIDAESTELPGVAGALSGSTELEELRQEADVEFSASCRRALEPFVERGEVSDAALHAVLGAADGIARALVLEQIGFEDGREALARVVAGVVRPLEA